MKNRLLLLTALAVSGSLVAMDQNYVFRSITPPPAPQLDPCEVKKEAVRRGRALRDVIQEVERASQPTRNDLNRLRKAICCARGYVHTAQVGSMSASQCLQTLVYDAQELLDRVTSGPVLDVRAQDSANVNRRIRDRSPEPAPRESLSLGVSSSPEVTALPEVQSLSLSEGLSREFYQTRYEEFYDSYHAILVHSEHTSEECQELERIRNLANMYAREAAALPGFPNGFFCIACDAERLLKSE
ncbi:hypothetical protein [Methylicorpusculum sp.]|uniref:hypothetical protein n=1 Tax=Methylicorpusculum sp. TaxID=2713644 RepID=UPI002AB8ABDC|nr:hypothetical protein [Methylicorpusculum sp.]MDZ4153457.1 hypothetical protein [Methylicorpusculum sp.]